jgi:hypothetical protein
MRKKFVAAPVALVAALALATGSVSADEVETDVDVEVEDVETECGDDVPADHASDEPAKTELDEMTEAAEEAAEAVADMVEDEENEKEGEEDDCVTDHDRAKESLQAAFDRLSVEGVGGNGVASEVLAALLAGKSPAGIGAAHGKEMANAAAARRVEREEARGGQPEDARSPESADKPDKAGRPDNAGRPGGSVDEEPQASDHDAKAPGADSGKTRGKPAKTGKPAGKGRP